VVREEQPGDPRLVAYVVARQENPRDAELREFLRKKLPDYMVPAAFLPLDKLPLTPSGKVDRRALPVPEQTRPDLDETYAPPRTRTEEVLTDIWNDVLGLKQIGVHDNFFELGGHSLLMTQVMVRTRETFGVDLSLRRLFEAPTISQLAVAIEERLVEEIEGLSEEEAKRLAVN
jgi:acyl carrier protein